jgi:hypothetical protein
VCQTPCLGTRHSLLKANVRACLHWARMVAKRLAQPERKQRFRVLGVP